MTMQTSPLNNNDPILLKPYSSKELAGIYGVTRQTFSKWLQPFNPEIGQKQGRFYTVAQVKIIFQRLGLPGFFTDD